MRLQLVLFFLIIFLMVGYTAYKGTQIWPHTHYIALSLTILLFVLMLGSQITYRYDTSVFNATWYKALTWAGTLAMGVWGTFIFLSLPFDLINIISSFFTRFFPESFHESSRRQFFSPNLYLSLFGLSSGIASLGLIQALKGPSIKKIAITLPKLPNDLRGLKIAQISDLHVGPTIRKEYVEKVVHLTNQENPDLIFITGDLVDAKSFSIHDLIEPLKNLKAKYGVFYVTGNHEYYWEAESLLKEIKELGIIPLLNENKILSINNALVMIAGVTDPMGEKTLPHHKPDTSRARRSDIKTDLNILLSHRPDACFEAEPLGFHLQFSGHTHAGQFFPFNMVVGLVHRYYQGLNHYKNMWVYVNPGTGYWGPANRFAVPSEISLITLYS